MRFYPFEYHEKKLKTLSHIITTCIVSLSLFPAQILIMCIAISERSRNSIKQMLNAHVDTIETVQNV